jgi:hypothetical protein
MRLFSWNLFAARRIFQIEVAGGANRTRRCWRTSGFFRFLLMANEMAGELPTRPVRRLIPLCSNGKPLLTFARHSLRQAPAVLAEEVQHVGVEMQRQAVARFHPLLAGKDRNQFLPACVGVDDGLRA